ncbi:A-kinase anchor protein 9 isoform 2-like protein [Camelus ferus]|nr:A-kinase anchor protein 9 isoform 2-like protein [Camelus ferus]
MKKLSGSESPTSTWTVTKRGKELHSRLRCLERNRGTEVEKSNFRPRAALKSDVILVALSGGRATALSSPTPAARQRAAGDRAFLGEAMEDEERQKKLEAGKAKLAQFRQRKAQSDGQNPKKQKKKRKTLSSKHDMSACHAVNIEQSQSDEMCINSSQRLGSAVTPESTIMRTLHSGEIIKRDQVFSVEPESEISTTADDYSSEEEEFGVDDSYSEHGAQYNQTHLEMMENELAEKQHEVEELNRELEEMRATYGTEGLQQCRHLRIEYFGLLFIFKLQASETLRNSTHSSTAADLLQAKQQILTHQQQLEEQDHLLEDYHKKKEDFKMQISFLQEKIRTYEMEQDKKVESSNKEIQEKEAVIEELNAKIIEEEKKSLELKDKVTTADKLLEELQEQVVQKKQEIKNMKLELTNSKQKERQCSEEIKQLMGTVEELQKKNHKDSQFEIDILQRMEQETQRKLEQLRAELDEMYGQQIVQMKQELIKQHMSQIDELKTRHKGEMENALRSYPNTTINEDQIKLMNMAINELNIKLQDTNSQKEKLKEELGVISGEKSALQRQLEDLFEELSFSREQIQRARQTIAEQESKLSEAHKSLSTVEDLKAEIVSASESRKELELKHEAEVTNYKIKLEMLEREKNAVLDRMAESQEAELERLRTQLLFSHEEELSKLKEDLEIEHRINIEKLKDNLGIHYKQQIDGLQNEMSQKIETMQFEKDNLITKQNQLILEISNLKDLQQSLMNSKSEEMTFQINELQKEIEILRQEEKEKGTLEQEVQELQLKTELLEKQMKEKEDDLQEKFAQLEAENSILKDEKKALEDMLKIYTPANQEERLIFIDSIKSRSKDCNWEKEIEILTEENEDLKKQCIQLTEEIEKQRNTFSFAEKNFEVNYQELQEDYACLLKVKTDLEDSKNKQEVEYKSKLKALSEELHHLQRVNTTTVKMKTSVFDDDKTFIAEPLETGEVVEKDTTELMEKLEITKREKLELSERLSDLSEQLKQKHGEITFLSEEVKSLKQEKEQVLLRCRELEIIINCNRTENVNLCDVHLSSSEDGVLRSRDFGGSVSKINKDFGEDSEIMEEEKIAFENMTLGKENKQEQVLDHLPLVTNESSPGAAEPSENDKLQRELSVLKSEQVREFMENEKDKALCSLKEELISAQEEKVKELQKIHQLELQNIKTQKTGDQMKPLQMLIGELRKAVSEECSHFTQIQRQQTGDVKLEFAEENLPKEETDFLLTCSQMTNLQDTDARNKSKLSTLQDIQAIRQLEGQVQELENLVSSLQQQLKENEENYGVEIHSLQERLQAVNESTVQQSFSIDSVVITESDVQKTVYPGSCLKQNVDGTTEFSDELGVKQETNMVKLLEKQYQERLEEEVAKVIVSMSIAFAQQTELSRISGEKEDATSSKEASLCRQEQYHLNEMKLSEGQVCFQASETTDMKSEEFKPLSKELGGDGKEVLLSNKDNLDTLEPKDRELTISEEMFFKDKTFIVREPLHDEILVSSMDASRQLMLNEEQLEDMRQELVRQYQEHQQATELLRQAHMRQMERQREDQEQLQEEIKRLNKQLAQRSSIDNENLVSERERVLLEELEALKQLSLAGREKLCCELRNSSTQTQNESENQEVEEQSFKEKELDRKPEEVPPEILSNERYALQKANNRLLKILLEVVKTTAAVEETIGRHVLGILDRSSKGQSSASLIWRSEAEKPIKSCVHEEHTGVTDDSVPSYSGSDIPRSDSSIWSKVTEEGTELSQRLMRSGFAGTEIDPENEDLMLNISSRLQAAVEKLLEAISETSNQLEHAKVTQTELMRESFRQKQEAAESLKCQEELRERLHEESKAREQLAVELSKAEGVIDGYADEKMLFERQIQEKTDIIDRLEQELLCAELLQETEKLMKEKLEVQCQAEKVRDDLQKQVKALEIDVEEQVSRFIELEQEKNAELMDLRQQNQALEKQLEKMRKFLDVEQLTNHLKEKTDKCSELLLSKEQLQRDIQERNEEIEKLEFRVRELEQALLVSTDTFQKITNLEEQLEQFREELENKNEEVQQLHMQLEIQKKESTTRLQELEQENKLFKDEMEKLGFAIKESDAISTQDQHVLFGKFAQTMQEKEVEIDRLNEQITELQHQLKITTDNKVIEEKNELIRDLETQIECLMSDQERVKKNTEEEIEQLNEVIEKLQQELANIEQKTSVDASSLPEEADSSKHQLDMVIAEKLALEKQVETTNEEMAFTKNVLKETNFKMNQLMQELCSLKRERESMGKIPSIPEQSINMATDDLSKNKPELEVVLTEDALKPLENQTYLRSFEENSKVSISSLKTKVLQLESTMSAKDLELTQCHRQIKDMQEQGQSEIEMLKKKIVNLQNILEEKIAAALVSQVQLEAVKEYAKFCQDKQAVSSELERRNMQNLSQLTENEMGSDVSALTLRISELESQMVEMQASLILEKEQVEIAEKNALEKEKKLLELQKLLEDSEKKERGKERKRCPEGDFEVLKTTTELIHTSEESGFFGQLEALRAESAATNEELASFKEIAEKLQEELLVKETNMAFLQKDLYEVRDQLTKAEEKLSYFLEKEDNTEVQENRKVCILEPLPIKVDKSSASQTGGTLKVHSSSQTPQILVRNTGIQIDLRSECSSEEVTEIINQFTEKIEQMQELHAAEILDMESRHISETETLKRDHYVAVQLLTEECGALKSVIQCLRSKEVYDSSQSHESFSDWRGELLLALQQVFLKERSVLLATFQTELTALGTRDAVELLNCLEQRIQEQSIEYQAAMECLQKADRRSLLSEIQALHAQMNNKKMTQKREQENDQPSQDLLEYNMQQKQSQMLEMQVELSSVKDRATELQEQLSSEKMVVAELKSELAQTKLELETTLKAQHKHLKELEAFRLEVKDKTDEVHLLNDTLASEQKKSRELQWALEKEKAKLGRSEERDKEELEDLKFSLEGQKQRNIQLNQLLEQQKQQLNESQQKIESQRVLHDAQLSEERGRNLELQVLLESEKVRIQEMSSTLDREREFHAQLQGSDDSGQPRPSLPSEDLLKELQKQLEEKHSRIVELLNETEKYKLDSLQTRQQMEKDRQVHRKTLQTEQEANTEGQKKMHELQSKVEDLQRQLEEKRQQVYKLDLEGKRLQDIMQEFQKRELEREEKQESRRILYQNLNEPGLVSPSPSCGSLTERLLRQNAELTGHISQLTEEKNDLRNMVMKLEEQIKWYRQTGAGRDYSSRFSFNGGPNIEAIIASEKEVWNREKLSLQKSLKRAEAEVYKLKAELRNEVLLQNLSPDSEHATIKRIYGKYLRAESFRKALIYQKKYLLLLLGGFQECEDATLALLARMGGQPAFTDLEVITNRPKGFTRFRSAVRVAMAISRYPGLPADLNPGSLACSQLQNYDPDRALTDYITRLEALQRRLGTVPSGSTQFHAGMRR